MFLYPTAYPEEIGADHAVPPIPVPNLTLSGLCRPPVSRYPRWQCPSGREGPRQPALLEHFGGPACYDMCAFIICTGLWLWGAAASTILANLPLFLAQLRYKNHGRSEIGQHKPTCSRQLPRVQVDYKPPTHRLPAAWCHVRTADPSREFRARISAS
jgi:hypothetical protein